MLHPNIHKAFERLKTEVSTQESVEVLASVQNAKPNFGAQALAQVSGSAFLKNPNLHKEVFGPFSLLVRCKDQAELQQIIEGLEGQLTGTILAESSELESLAEIAESLQQRVGRIIFNGVPTGVEVCPSMQHGGPYPASTDARFTAVGVHSIRRWIRPISFQNFPEAWLPKELKNG
jgi:NADP-dependent aldehyde dehydrogenase